MVLAWSELALTPSVSLPFTLHRETHLVADGNTILGHSSGSNNQGNSNVANSHNLIGKVVRPFFAVRST
jgi:hypothetical protein